MIAAAQRLRRLWLSTLALCGLLLTTASAQAHLMAAQKGTLNLVGDAAFVVLSVPVSALQGADDDGDGALSRAELGQHTVALRQQIQAGVQLRSTGNGPLPLQLLMLDVSAPEGQPEAPSRHLMVLGRFQLPPQASAGTNPASSGDLSLSFTLFGTRSEEQQQDLTITRQQETQWLRFVPERATHTLLPTTSAVVADYLRSGAEHVLSGADHLLFLLVVLAAGWGWRPLLGALTCFTLGHALTLLACVWGGWSPSAAVVEPAIAATIVGLALFDVWVQRRGRPLPTTVRLALVFACALIHGLGLAGALAELTQWPVGSPAMLWALAGFNLGIELAQVGVAAVASLALMGLRRVLTPGVQQRASQFATLAVLATGSLWLVERVLQAA